MKLWKYTLWPIADVPTWEKPPWVYKKHVWITQDDWEGMSVSIEELDKLIWEYYKTNF